MKHSNANTTVAVATPCRKATTSPSVVAGIDVGDTMSRFCLLEMESGKIISQGRISTTTAGLDKLLDGYPRVRVAIEVGTHSAWIARHIERGGHEVIVANSRKLRAIYQSDQKTDAHDARMLAKLARLDPTLLHPIKHRSGQSQIDLTVLRARDELVGMRTHLINTIRGTVKANGDRIRSCGSEGFHKVAREALPSSLRDALGPLVKQVGQLTTAIRSYDKLLTKLCAKYPATARLQQIKGVGDVTSLAFVLTVETPQRFKSARSVGAYIGLCPRLDQSGQQDRQLRITKAGDVDLRRLLVGCAHYILGPFGKDCDLRRHGLKLAERGGKNGKKRAVVAVARKLSVVLLTLWANDAAYEPLRNAVSHA